MKKRLRKKRVKAAAAEIRLYLKSDTAVRVKENLRLLPTDFPKIKRFFHLCRITKRWW